MIMEQRYLAMVLSCNRTAMLGSALLCDRTAVLRTLAGLLFDHSYRIRLSSIIAWISYCSSFFYFVYILRGFIVDFGQYLSPKIFDHLKIQYKLSFLCKLLIRLRSIVITFPPLILLLLFSETYLISLQIWAYSLPSKFCLSPIIIRAFFTS